ncbi:OLC1v1010407C1 [Oldenlandia corymbosa var. corymbosa]|uniref:OLC1v1010407C1 n=1 Tax=Oldenlandia corymbosa var. corymbosa TaxID=529605 RepID=A0AAV1DR94_OLDCO|nr:OLC1v1010407C1 [Oldenlandia corymbosa var. corymbosa]
MDMFIYTMKLVHISFASWCEPHMFMSSKVNQSSLRLVRFLTRGSHLKISPAYPLIDYARKFAKSRSGENSNPKLPKYCDDGDDLDAIPVDRISDLPEAIICHILSFLPTKEVVATSFLSKSWKDQWTKVTNLEFDDRDGVGGAITIGIKKNLIPQSLVVLVS